MEFTIFIDDYRFIIELIHYVHQEPDFYADNADDYFGYTSVDWKCIECFDYDELSDREIVVDTDIASLYSKVIEEKLLEQINQMREEERPCLF